MSGQSHLDQARSPARVDAVGKGTGVRSDAGSINQSGALKVRVERVGRDTSYGRIVEAVEAVEALAGAGARLADQLAGARLLRVWGRGSDLRGHQRRPVDGVGHHCGRRLRDRGWHAASKPAP